MRPTAPLVTLARLLLFLFGATASNSSPSSDSSSKSSNGYDAVMCGQNGYTGDSGFSFSSDAWNAEGNGFQCLSVINGSSLTSAGFDATWYWPVDADTVHSFPHVTFSSDDLPISLNNISAIRLAASWAMSAGTISTAQSPSTWIGVDDNGLSYVGAKANVAFDMFLGQDEEASVSATNASYEIMVWIGRVGQPYPLGYDSKNATCYTQQLGSFNFTLYSGQNSRGTSVYTWVSPSDETTFDEDISPLLQYLWRKELVSADARLGLVEFGSEAYHSEKNVSFSAGGFSLQVWKGEPPAFDLNPIGEDCGKPTSPPSPQSTGKPKKSTGAQNTGSLIESIVTMVSMTSIVFLIHQCGILRWV